MPARSSYVWDRERREWVPRDDGGSFQRIAVKETINGFMSRSLPKWYPYAPRHVQSGRHRGACVFNSRKEAEECVARANNEGEHLSYDY